MIAGDRAAAAAGVRVARWLERENGNGQLQQVIQILGKTMEELDEVRLELLRGTYERAVCECVDLAITARTAQASLGAVGGPVPEQLVDAGRDVADRREQLTQVVIELGAVVISWTQQNPRKRANNVGVSDKDVADHLDHVVLEACRLIHALGFDVDEVLLAGAEKLHRRLDEMGVPR